MTLLITIQPNEVITLDALLKFLEENGAICLLAVAVTTFIINRAVVFLKMSRDQQIAKVKECLLSWVIEAERQLGAGTGDAKLSMVYGLFVQSFPFMKNFVSIDTFKKLVSEALEQMEEMLSDTTNTHLSQLIDSANTVTLDGDTLQALQNLTAVMQSKDIITATPATETEAVQG